MAAAGGWSSLSAEYISVADELTTVLGEVQAGAWQGPSAEQYVAAHAPYLAWLTQAGVDSAEVAAQHEVAATAYSSALAAMPTLAELAANHMIHGVLVATNFFGINTIPIALNEADYVRMWIQAATTMGTYHAVSGAALASAPRTAPAPVVLAANSASAAAQPPSSGNFFTDLYKQLGQLFQNPVGILNQIIAAFSTNPAAALMAYGPTLLLAGFAVYEVVSPFTNLAYIGIVLPVIAAIVNAATGPPELVAEPDTGAPGPRPLLAGTNQPKTVQQPVVAMAPTIATPGAPAAPASAPGNAAGAPAAPAPAAVGFGYLVGGVSGPDAGPGPTSHDRPGTKAPAALAPAAVVRVSEKDRSRARRRRRARMKGFADEFMDMNVDVDPDWGTPEEQSTTAASESGAGALGFTGTADKFGVTGATGLTTLAGDEFGGGPSVPMLPESWGDRESGPSESESE
jgi:PPE-repeat protein